MKTLICTLLTVLLCCTMSINVFAAEADVVEEVLFESNFDSGSNWYAAQNNLVKGVLFGVNYDSVVGLYAEESELKEEVVHEINCDTADGWFAPVNATDPYVPFLEAGGTIDTDDKMEGTGALSLVGNPDAFAGPAINFQYIPNQSIDLSAMAKTGEIRFWLYVSNPSFHVMNECQFEVTSSGTFDMNEMQWMLNTNNLKLKKGWNEVVLKVAEATSQGGECDLKNVNYIRFWCLMMPADTIVKLDGIQFVAYVDESALEPDVSGGNTGGGNTVIPNPDPVDPTPPEPEIPEPEIPEPEIPEPEDVVTYEVDCDTTEGWRATNSDSWWVPFGESGGVVDAENKQEGDACLSVETQPFFDLGYSVNLEYRPDAPVDLQVTKETGAVKFWLYTEDPFFHAANACQFEINSSPDWDTNELTWNLNPENMPLEAGWNEITLNMADAIYSNGECDLAAVQIIRFYALFSSENTTIKIDDIRIVDLSATEGTEAASGTLEEEPVEEVTEEAPVEEPIDEPIEESIEEPVEEPVA